MDSHLSAILERLDHRSFVRLAQFGGEVNLRLGSPRANGAGRPCAEFLHKQRALTQGPAILLLRSGGYLGAILLKEASSAKRLRSMEEHRGASEIPGRESADDRLTQRNT